MAEPFAWPIAGQKPGSSITGPFGTPQVRAPGFTGPLGETNNGMDVGVPEGTKIVSPISGTVVEIRHAGVNDAGWGNSVVIKDASGDLHRLSHLRGTPYYTEGQQVTAGAELGQAGKTGNATGPHLDWEVVRGGKNINPMTLFPPQGAPSVAEKTSLDKLNEDLARLEGRRPALEAASKGTGPVAATALESLTALDVEVGKTRDRILAEENRQRDDSRAGNVPPTVRDINGQPHQWNVDAKEWQPLPGTTPGGPPPKPETASELALRGAQTTAQQANARQSDASTRVAEQQLKGLIAQADKDDIQAQKFAEFRTWAEDKLKQTESKDPAERLAARRELSERAALLDSPKTLMQYLSDETDRTITQWQQLETTTGQRYDPLTLQPVMDASGQPVYTAAERTRRETQEAQLRQEAAQERQEFARGAQSVAALETQRAGDFTQAMGQFEQSGVATGGRIAGLNALRQPLGETQVAAMLGLEPDDPKFLKFQQLRSQLGQPTTRPSGPAGDLPGMTPPPVTPSPGVSPTSPGQTRPIGLAPMPAASGQTPPVPASVGLVQPSMGPSLTAPPVQGQTIAPPVAAPNIPNGNDLSPLQRLIAQSGALQLRQPVAV